MPNIGFGELMVLVLVALIVFGPDRLPEMARSVGKFVRGFQRETSRALSDLKEGLEPVKAGVFDEPDPLGLGSFIDSDAAANTIEPDDVPAAIAEPAAVPPVAAVKRAERARTQAKTASRPRKPAAGKRTPARAAKAKTTKAKTTKAKVARSKPSKTVRRGTTRKR